MLHLNRCPKPFALHNRRVAILRDDPCRQRCNVCVVDNDVSARRVAHLRALDAAVAQQLGDHVSALVVGEAVEQDPGAMKWFHFVLQIK